ncbi:MAG TPA: tetratricopeptide repeat protein [Blastocatellia bacterium]
MTPFSWEACVCRMLFRARPREVARFLFVAILLALGSVSSSAQGAQGPTQSPAQMSRGTAEFRQAAGENPLAIARQYYRTGRLDDALAEYNKALQADPKSALAYAGMVDIYLAKKRPTEAYDTAAKAAALEPSSDRVRVALGEVYFRQGKMTEAEKEFSDLIRAGTTEPRAFLGLSRIYRTAAFYEHAKLIIDRAYQLDPGDPDILRERSGYLSVAERIKALQLSLSMATFGDPDESSSCGRLC